MAVDSMLWQVDIHLHGAAEWDSAIRFRKQHERVDDIKPFWNGRVAAGPHRLLSRAFHMRRVASTICMWRPVLPNYPRTGPLWLEALIYHESLPAQSRGFHFIIIYGARTWSNCNRPCQAPRQSCGTKLVTNYPRTGPFWLETRVYHIPQSPH